MRSPGIFQRPPEEKNCSALMQITGVNSIFSNYKITRNDCCVNENVLESNVKDTIWSLTLGYGLQCFLSQKAVYQALPSASSSRAMFFSLLSRECTARLTREEELEKSNLRTR